MWLLRDHLPFHQYIIGGSLKVLVENKKTKQKSFFFHPELLIWVLKTGLVYCSSFFILSQCGCFLHIHDGWPLIHSHLSRLNFQHDHVVCSNLHIGLWSHLLSAWDWTIRYDVISPMLASTYCSQLLHGLVSETQKVSHWDTDLRIALLLHLWGTVCTSPLWPRDSMCWQRNGCEATAITGILTTIPMKKFPVVLFLPKPASAVNLGVVGTPCPNLGASWGLGYDLLC